MLIGVGTIWLIALASLESTAILSCETTAQRNATLNNAGRGAVVPLVVISFPITHDKCEWANKAAAGAAADANGSTLSNAVFSSVKK